MNSKLLISLLMAGTVSSLSAAVNISAPTRLSTGDVPAHNPVLSPDGAHVLFSADDQTGLNLMTIGSGKIVTIEKDVRGAGFAPIFSRDGQSVFYQTAAVIDGLTNRDIRSFTISSGKKAEVRPMSRATVDLNASAGTSTYVRSNFATIELTTDGVKSEISPLADAHSYLWPSLSPDGSKLLFVEPFEGLFIAEADGSNPVKVADKADYPAWVSNDLVSFVTSHDDGYVILDSTLKVIDLTTGETTDVTPADVKVGEASSANSMVVYTTLDGEMFRLTVTK